MGIVIPLLLIILTSIIIWKSSDGFDVASSYLGRNLSDGVKGLLLMLFLVLCLNFNYYFLFSVFEDAEGFSGGIGTVAGVQYLMQ